jgi:hypothetical protein
MNPVQRFRLHLDANRPRELCRLLQAPEAIERRHAAFETLRDHGPEERERAAIDGSSFGFPSRDGFRRNGQELCEVDGAKAERLAHEAEYFTAALASAGEPASDFEIESLQDFSGKIGLAARDAFPNGQVSMKDMLSHLDRVLLGGYVEFLGSALHTPVDVSQGRRFTGCHARAIHHT